MDWLRSRNVVGGGRTAVAQLDRKCGFNLTILGENLRKLRHEPAAFQADASVALKFLIDATGAAGCLEPRTFDGALSTAARNRHLLNGDGNGPD